MKNKINFLLFFTAAIVLTSCAKQYNEAPIATNFLSTEQPKLQAASHWNLITQDIAAELLRRLPTTSMTQTRLYVETNIPSSPFNTAVKNQLITSLVNAGEKVSKTPEYALDVNIDTQVIQFSRYSYEHDLTRQFVGAPTLIASGIWAIAATQPSTAGAVTALVAGNDTYTWFTSKYATGDVPKTEIIVNVSISNDREYLARSTTVYYVSDTDEDLYSASAAKHFTVVGN